MSKYQRPHVFPGDFDAVAAHNTLIEIRHDCGGLGGIMRWEPSCVVGFGRHARWAEPNGLARAPRWVCSCGARWTDKRVKEIAVQDPGGTFWRQEVAGG